MATMNISIPAPMKDWVQNQVESGFYANASDYIRDLIRQDQARRERHQALQLAITKGIESGTSDSTVEEVLEKARAYAAGRDTGTSR